MMITVNNIERYKRALVSDVFHRIKLFSSSEKYNFLKLKSIKEESRT